MGTQDSAKSAYRRGLYGDIEDHVNLIAALQNSHDRSQVAWAFALQAQLFVSGVSATAPQASELAAWAGDKDRLEPTTAEPVSLACALGTQIAFLSFDGTDLDRWATVLHRHQGLDPLIDARFAVSSAWAAFGNGRRFDVASLEAVQSLARARKDAPLTIEATVVQSLLASEHGLRTARRASRMARTENMPQLQYLANLVLARHRRLERRPHLAAYILKALMRVAPAPWATWLQWELTLAGAEAPVKPPASHLRALIDTALNGDESSVQRFIEAPPACNFSPVRDDLVDAAKLILGDASGRCEGLTALAGFHPDARLAAAPIWVACRDQQAAR
ncbi:MAG: hypothetical protein AAFV29_04510, partial [Myxococcota bacterium]